MYLVISVVYSPVCPPWIGSKRALFRKWVRVVGEIGYDDTRWFNLIDGVESIEELLHVVRIIFDGVEYFQRIITNLIFVTVPTYSFYKDEPHKINRIIGELILHLFLITTVYGK